MKLKRSQYEHIPPSDVELAWLAGIWEGEGCWQHKKGRTRLFENGRTYTEKDYLRIAVQMTDKDIVDRVAYIMDRRTVTKTDVPSKRKLGRKPLYTFALSGKPAILWTNLMLPHLGIRRQEKVQMIYETIDTELVWIQ